MTDTRPTLPTLAPRQAEVLAFIVEFPRLHGGLGPLVREIAARFQISRQCAHDHIKILIARGLAERDGRSPRSLRGTAAGLANLERLT
jgi:DNA-binding MarR family transcriptional regulator